MTASAMQSVVPVATKISGSVTLQTSHGAHLDVVTSRLLHSGDTVLTGRNSLGAVDFADVGRVVVGPASSALARTGGTGLSVQISSGMLCVESQTATVTITAGGLKMSPAAAPAVFNVIRTGGETIVAVYRGSIALADHGSKASTLQTGEATISANDGTPTPTALSAVNASFSPLHCPDQALVRDALSVAAAAPAAAPAVASGGHGGGIFGWILGLAAIAVAAGHGGGGGAADAGALPPAQDVSSPSASPRGSPTASPTPTPTSTSSPTPTPTPTSTPTSEPDSIAVDPTSLSLTRDGDPQTFNAEDPAARNYFASSSNPDVATVSLADQHDHRARFDVAPAREGTATITVSDDAGHQGTVSVTVRSTDISTTSSRSASCPLVVSTQSLVFSNATGIQHVLVSAPCHRGLIRARSSNDGVASIDPQSTQYRTQNFIVTARSAGTALLTISDDVGTTQIIRVIVLEARKRR